MGDCSHQNEKFLRLYASPRTAAHLSGAIVIESSPMFNQFPERVLHLGDDHNLIAIAAETGTPSTTKPTVLMLNAGVLHRVGPRRLHVALARILARVGFATCRVDLSGIGDSRVITGNRSFRESAVADTVTVMDHIARESGAQRFVLFGLCSGADNALAVAANDTRVAGLVLIDAPSYPTLRSYVRKFIGRAARLGPVAVATATLAAAARFSAHLVFRRPQSRAESGGRQAPPKAEHYQLLDRLTNRGTRVLCVHSAAMRERYNDKDQLFELYPKLRGRVDTAYFGDADHVFTEIAAQTRLIDTVVAWLNRNYS